MRRIANSGLSQLELMISLAIMGLIAVLLANALDFNRQSLVRAQLLSAASERLVLRHRLRSWAEAMPLEKAKTGGQVLLQGGHNSLQFVTLVTDGSFAAEAPVTVRLTLSEGQGVPSLRLQRTGQHPTTGAPLLLQSVLAEGVSQLTLSYYGRISGEAQKRWHEAWSDDKYLPDLIKLEWVQQSNRPAPPLTLHLARAARQRYMSLSSLVPPE